MHKVTDSEKAEFFKAVDDACKKAVWCAIATVDGNEPRVRIVHPTWDGEVLWGLSAYITLALLDLTPEGAPFELPEARIR